MLASLGCALILKDRRPGQWSCCMSRVSDCALFLAGMVCAACVPREPDPVVVAQRAIERSNSGSHTVAMAMLLPAEIESAARSGTTIVDLLVHRVPNFRLTRANRVACPH